MGEVINIGVQTLDEAEQQEILESIKRIETINTQVTKGCMELGWEGAKIQSLAEKGSWGVAGFKDQHDFRIAKGIGRANWYRHVGVATHFFGCIGKQVYLAMKMENAERLSVEKSHVRFDPQILSDAGSMSVKEFGDMLTNLVAHEEGKPVRQHFVEIRLRLQKEQRDRIEENMKAWCEQNGIDDNGDSFAYALELLSADAAQGPGLAAFLMSAIPTMTKAARETEDVLDLKALLIDFLMDINNRVHLCYGEMDDQTEDVA